jgi:hypothetical protein
MRMSLLDEPPAPPPTNIEAEQAVLGSIMLTNRTIEAVRPILRPEHFSEPVHGRIYAAALRHADAGRLADPITLKREFDADEGLRELGGAKYLAGMAAAAQNVQSATEYAKVIQQLAFKRALAEVARKLEHAARNGAAPLDAWVEAKDAFERLAPEHGGEGSARAQLVSASTWTREPPPRRWLVEGWLPRREVTLLNGKGGVGKSLLLQQLMASAAAGLPWLGLPCEPGAALAMMCEDDAEELERRQRDILRHLGIGPSDLGDRLNFWPRRGHLNALFEVDASGQPRRTALFEELLDLCRWKRPSIIGLDTAAHVYGGDENNRNQVTAFVCGVGQALADEFDAAVVICQHPSRSGEAEGSGRSGSTGWEGSVRSRLYLRPTQDGAEERLLTTEKANYGPKGKNIVLKWSAGVMKTLEELTGETRPAAGSVFLHLLAELRRQGRNVSDKDRANNYAPLLMSRMSSAQGYTMAELQQAMTRLFGSGRIRMGSVRGEDRHEYRTIVSVGEE